KNLSHVDALHVMDAEHMSFEDNSFDAVLALYVASVVPNPARFAEEMRRVCIPGGTIVLVNHFTSENWALRWMEKRLAHLARHIGGRFSRKLASPSAASALRRRDAASSTIRSCKVSNGASTASPSSFLVIATASGPAISR